ncbi:MAG: hypothetical protein V4764_17795 [Burkholderia sp.]
MNSNWSVSAPTVFAYLPPPYGSRLDIAAIAGPRVRRHAVHLARRGRETAAYEPHPAWHALRASDFGHNNLAWQVPSFEKGRQARGGARSIALLVGVAVGAIAVLIGQYGGAAGHLGPFLVHAPVQLAGVTPRDHGLSDAAQRARWQVDGVILREPVQPAPPLSVRAATACSEGACLTHPRPKAEGRRPLAQEHEIRRQSSGLTKMRARPAVRHPVRMKPAEVVASVKKRPVDRLPARVAEPVARSSDLEREAFYARPEVRQALQEWSTAAPHRVDRAPTWPASRTNRGLGLHEQVRLTER